MSEKIKLFLREQREIGLQLKKERNNEKFYKNKATRISILRQVSFGITKKILRIKIKVKVCFGLENEYGCEGGKKWNFWRFENDTIV